MSGFLKITFGPMYSEKTSDLIQNIRNHHIIDKIRGEIRKGLVVNHLSDEREIKGVGSLSTHNDSFSRSPLPPTINFIKTKKLTSLKKMLDEYNYIAIDECQFFEDLIPFVLEMIEKGKYVHCVGLIADSEQKEMGELWKLIPYADDVIHKKAYCVKCKSPYRNASFTKYIGEGEKRGQIHIGAGQEYVPVCREHL
ncbi:MAG: Thymidine kinase [Chlamydiia bacterium]|nr:Thymidine kinase [Chlamydiia bacterium]